MLVSHEFPRENAPPLPPLSPGATYIGHDLHWPRPTFWPRHVLAMVSPILATSRGFTGQPERKQAGPDRPKHHQNSTRTPPRERKKDTTQDPQREKVEMGVGEGKKTRNFGRSGGGLSCPAEGGPGLRGPLAKIGLAPPRSAQIGQVKGCGQSWPGHGQSRSGQSRPGKSGP